MNKWWIERLIYWFWLIGWFIDWLIDWLSDWWTGIDISEWVLKEDDKAVTFSVWDFAGQTVYYNTHQVIYFNYVKYVLWTYLTQTKSNWPLSFYRIDYEFQSTFLLHRENLYNIRNFVTKLVGRILNVYILYFSFSCRTAQCTFCFGTSVWVMNMRASTSGWAPFPCTPRRRPSLSSEPMPIRYVASMLKTLFNSLSHKDTALSRWIAFWTKLNVDL